MGKWSGEFFSKIAQALPLALKIFGGIATLMVFFSLIVYGVSIYFENQIIHLGKITRQVQEDNQDLQITLDRTRSYKKVADVSAKLQDGLQVASETVDVAEVLATYNKPIEPHTDRLPYGAYGY